VVRVNSDFNLAVRTSQIFADAPRRGRAPRSLLKKARHGRALDCGLDSRSEWMESNATPSSYAPNVITFEVVGDELTMDRRRVPHLINASRFSAKKLCWS
jgi:hypothetical protein